MREVWRHKDMTEKQLRSTLAESREAKASRIDGEMGTQQEPEPEGRGSMGWLVGMLGRRRDTPRWENELVWKMEIMGWRRGDAPVGG